MKNNFMRYISIIYRSDNAFYNNKFPNTHLSGLDYGILGYVVAKKSCLQEVLVSDFKIDKATTTKALDRLEREQLVTRDINPNDRRSKIIHITKSGIKFNNEIRSANEEWHNAMTYDITEEEISEFIRLSEIISKNAWNYIQNKDRNSL